MEENKVETVENQVENNTEEQAGGEIVIQQPGKVKKILKWVGTGLAVVAAFVGGMLLGKDKTDDGGTNDSAESESPEE